MNKLNRAQRLREHMGKYKSGGGASFWKPEVGDSRIRILPETGNMEFFYQPVGIHSIKVAGEKNKQQVICPDFTSEGANPCPICELSQELYDQGEKKLAGANRVRKQFRMNIIVRGSKKKGTSDSEPKIYTPGIQVFEQIFGIINDEEYCPEDPETGENILPSDVYQGRDLKVNREGTTYDDTEYNVLPAASSTPLFDTEEAIAAALEKSTDLSKILSNLPSYDELAKMVASEDIEDEEDEEEEPRRPAKKTAVKSATKKAAPARNSRISEEEYDEEDEDEDVFDD